MSSMQAAAKEAPKLSKEDVARMRREKDPNFKKSEKKESSSGAYFRLYDFFRNSGDRCSHAGLRTRRRTSPSSPLRKVSLSSSCAESSHHLPLLHAQAKDLGSRKGLGLMPTRETTALQTRGPGSRAPRMPAQW